MEKSTARSPSSNTLVLKIAGSLPTEAVGFFLLEKSIACSTIRYKRQLKVQYQNNEAQDTAKKKRKKIPEQYHNKVHDTEKSKEIKKNPGRRKQLHVSALFWVGHHQVETRTSGKIKLCYNGHLFT
jgi:hypothetical protein